MIKAQSSANVNASGSAPCERRVVTLNICTRMRGELRELQQLRCWWRGWLRSKSCTHSRQNGLHNACALSDPMPRSARLCEMRTSIIYLTLIAFVSDVTRCNQVYKHIIRAHPNTHTREYVVHAAWSRSGWHVTAAGAKE